jgi:hypothetical protein
MNTLRIRRKLESDTLYLPELKPLIGKNVDIIVEERESEEAGCFSQASGPKPLTERDKQALRELLTADQLEALDDIVSHGGPNVDIIARLRSKSMT